MCVSLKVSPPRESDTVMIKKAGNSKVQVVRVIERAMIGNNEPRISQAVLEKIAS